jgi:choline dehydrogenase-like flavoprotein
MPWSADVIIVGSGVAGSLVATRLARAGVKVVILEAGPRIQRAAALAQYRDALIKIPECPYPDTPYAPHPVSDNPDHYYLQDGPDKFASPYLRLVGGTTWHWLGTTLRFVPDDFKLRSRFGVGEDWPITYEDLEPWYCEAERELGVAGDPNADLNAPRSQPYPLPPIPLSYADQRTAAALKGSPYSVQPTPQARNSERYDNRPACCGSASCIPICPVQAKYDATSHVAKAEGAGAQVVPEAIVSRVEVGDDGRISALVVKRPDGSEDRAVAKVFVIAAHGIETPKLLLQSRTDRRPGGVANSSDQVGRNLMDHPCQLNWVLAGEPLGMYRGPLSTAGIESTRAGDWRGDRAAFRIQLDNRGWEWPTGGPATTVRELIKQGLRGADLDQALADRSTREMNIVPMVEQLPLAENRIVPDFDRRDAIGIPRPRMTYRIDDYSKRALEHGRRIAREIAKAMNATEVHEGPDIVSSGHVMGTYRMGVDPKRSVVTPDHRAHDHANLFLLGSGVFPTSAASNPTLTIAALALRAVTAIQRATTGP